MTTATDPRIHPSATIGKDVSLGQGVVVGPQSIIYDNVFLGDYCYVGPRVTIGEPDQRFYQSAQYEFPHTIIGSHAIIRSGSIIYAGCEIGDNFRTGHYAILRERTIVGHNCAFGTFAQSDGECVLGNYVRLHYAAHICRTAKLGDYVWLFPYAVLTNDIHPPCMECVEGPVIDDYVVIATHSTVMPRVRIGSHSLVGANSVVTKDIPPDTVSLGTPAKHYGSVRDIKCDFENRVATPYPWPSHYSAGYPWEETGWDEEPRSDADPD